MECNKEEALRAKEIAESKFTTKDIVGAKKFALKALNLFPELEGINQMIATLDVYLAAETKINGENDWYSILCLNSSADEETVRKQYRKLALQLHPDKNKSIGSEGAFKLISEAWSVLSDENRKKVYDQKRKVNNGFYNFTNNVSSKKKYKKSPASTSQISNTFWTSCNRCKMQYEYLRVYLNHNLLCPNCHEAFLAVEIGFPLNAPASNFTWTTPQQNQHNQNFQWAPSTQAANMVHQTYEKVKKERVEAQRTVRKERKNSSIKRSITASGYISENFAKVDRPAKRGRSISEDTVKTSNMDAEIERAKTRISTRINKLSKIMLQYDKRSLLMAKAKGELSKKLEEWNAAASAKSKSKEKAKAKQKPKQKENSSVGDEMLVSNNKPNLIMKQVSKQASITVPDPEFHDFDKDRMERSFERDQVWATYDSEDGMPRFYALIQKVLSFKPFKVRMSFLNSKSNIELGPMNWVGSGFAKTCGYFRVGRYEISDTANIFSHRVKCEKGARGVVRIFPRKGETWGLYKNWSPDWNELTPDSLIHKYDIVEVIDDYDEEQGVLITPLVKVAGFRVVFHRHHDIKEVRRIPREEMFRFSHQVPSYLLKGDEAHNAPKGCLELDPAAIPSDLVKVITEFNEEATAGVN